MDFFVVNKKKTLSIKYINKSLRFTETSLPPKRICLFFRLWELKDLEDNVHNNSVFLKLSAKL